MAMLTFDSSIPQARVVRKGGQLYAPPPAPPSPERNRFRAQLRDAAALAIGLWPLTTVLLLAVGLLYIAGMNGSP